MVKERFTTEEIIHKLREADVLVGQGQTISEACKQIGVTEKTRRGIDCPIGTYGFEFSAAVSAVDTGRGH